MIRPALILGMTTIVPDADTLKRSAASCVQSSMRNTVLMIVLPLALVASTAHAAPATQPAATALRQVKLAAGMKRVEAERLIAEATGVKSKYDLNAMDSSKEVTYRDGPVALVVRYKPGSPAPWIKTPDGLMEHLAPIDGEVLSWEIVADDQPEGATLVAETIAGEWSEAVDGGSNLDGSNTMLRGRLLLGHKPPCRLDDGKMYHEAVLYVELADASDSVGSPMRIYFDPESLRCEVRTADGKLVPESGGPFGGGMPGKELINLPADCGVRLRVSPFGVRSVEGTGVAIALPRQTWRLPPGKAYFVSGSLKVAPPKDQEHHAWKGTLVLPRIKIGTDGEAH